MWGKQKQETKAKVMNELLAIIETTKTAALAFDGTHFILSDPAGRLDMKRVRELLDTTKATYGTSEEDNGTVRFRVGINSRHRDSMVNLCLLTYQRLLEKHNGSEDAA